MLAIHWTRSAGRAGRQVLLTPACRLKFSTQPRWLRVCRSNSLPLYIHSSYTQPTHCLSNYKVWHILKQLPSHTTPHSFKLHTCCSWHTSNIAAISLSLVPTHRRSAYRDALLHSNLAHPDTQKHAHIHTRIHTYKHFRHMIILNICLNALLPMY